jgi:hypothetical protein
MEIPSVATWSETLQTQGLFVHKEVPLLVMCIITALQLAVGLSKLKVNQICILPSYLKRNLAPAITTMYGNDAILGCRRHPRITCNKCEKEGVKETCPETCFNCDLPAPSTCKDSSLPFRFHEKKYNCDIVKSDSAFYCGLEGVIPGNVTSHCPAACDVPDCAGNKEETNMYFEILIGGKLKWKQCDPWIMQNNEKHCANRCGKSTVADTCPVTCAKCLV